MHLMQASFYYLKLQINIVKYILFHVVCSEIDLTHVAYCQQSTDQELNHQTRFKLWFLETKSILNRWIYNYNVWRGYIRFKLFVKCAEIECQTLEK